MNKNGWKSEDEFGCMLCSRICNTLLPLIPRNKHLTNRFNPQRSEEKTKDIKSEIETTANIPLWKWIRQCEDEIAPVKVQNKIFSNWQIFVGFFKGSIPRCRYLNVPKKSFLSTNILYRQLLWNLPASFVDS